MTDLQQALNFGVILAIRDLVAEDRHTVAAIARAVGLDAPEVAIIVQTIRALATEANGPHARVLNVMREMWWWAVHKLHWIRHREMHARSCTCKGSGRVPRRKGT